MMKIKPTIDCTEHDAPIRVDVRRRYDTVAEDAGHRLGTKKRGLSGIERWKRAFYLCLLGIPALWVIGTVLEVWFHYNGWGLALPIVLYTKALMYVGVWYILMTSYLNKGVSLAVAAVCLYAGLGMCPMANGAPWIIDWWSVQWSYWGFLFVSYWYFVYVVGHGPKHWITRFGG